jgi:hypothetical protein
MFASLLEIWDPCKYTASSVTTNTDIVGGDLPSNRMVPGGQAGSSSSSFICIDTIRVEGADQLTIEGLKVMDSSMI